jgi:hypothetical protein
MMTMMMMVNGFLLVHFFVVLWDFDYVVEIVKVNDEDHVDLILDLF